MSAAGQHSLSASLPKWIKSRLTISAEDHTKRTMQCNCRVRLTPATSADAAGGNQAPGVSPAASSRPLCNFAFADQPVDDITAITEHLRTAHNVTEPTITVRDAMGLLEKKMEFRVLLLELVPYLPFVMLFLNFVVWRYDFQATHYSASVLTNTLVDQDLPPQAYQGPDSILGLRSGPLYTQSFTTQMNTIGDWHRWFETLVIPTFYDSANPTAVPSRAGPVGQMLTVGALRVRTFRVRVDSCKVNKHFYSSSFANRNCYAPFSDDALDEAPLLMGQSRFVSPSACSIKESFADSLRGYVVNSYPCGGQSVLFGRDLSFDAAASLAAQLRTSGFLHRDASRMVAVEGLVYSPPSDSFVSLKLIAEISPGGSIFTSVVENPFYLLNAHFYSDGDRSSDIFLFFLVVFFWGLFLVNWIANRIWTGRLFAYLFDFWSIVELSILVTTTCAILLTWIQWSIAVSIRSGSILPDTTGHAFHGDLAYCGELYTLTTYFKSFGVVCVLLKFIKFFAVHNQLNILTRTLAAATKSIVGVLIVFALIVTAFALTGNLLYGPTVWNYSTLSLAFSSSFRALVGDFDYKSLYLRQKSLTFVYFWSFIVTGLFIMLNFITGIIGDKFDQESGRVRSASIGATLRAFVAYLRTLKFSMLVHRLRTREHRPAVMIIYTSLCVLVQAKTVPESQRVTRAFFTDLVWSQTDAVVASKERLDDIFDDLIESMELVRQTADELADAQLDQATGTAVRSAIAAYFEASTTRDLRSSTGDRADVVLRRGPDDPLGDAADPGTAFPPGDEGETFSTFLRTLAEQGWSNDRRDDEIDMWFQNRLAIQGNRVRSLEGLTKRMNAVREALGSMMSP